MYLSILLFLFFSVLENYPGETCPTGHSLFVTPFLGLPKRIVFGCLLFQVDIYPLKIHLTETMYRMMWEYFFPEEEQDSQRRQVGKNIQLKRIRLIQEYRSNFWTVLLWIGSLDFNYSWFKACKERFISVWSSSF